MKATGIVRRIDDLGRVVISKEIRRTMRIREGDPLLITLTPFGKFCWQYIVWQKGIMSRGFKPSAFFYKVLTFDYYYDKIIMPN